MIWYLTGRRNREYHRNRASTPYRDTQRCAETRQGRGHRPRGDSESVAGKPHCRQHRTRAEDQTEGAPRMNNPELIALLKRGHACADSLVWLGDRDLSAMWRECERGDWLLWYCARAGVERKLIVLAACACARLALPY